MKYTDNEYEVDQRIQYCLFDKKNKAHWLEGKIHGVRRYEDAATNTITKITYLVDTGRDERVDEVHFNHRDREVNRRINKLLVTPDNDIEDVQTALDAALNDPAKLPASKHDVERVRQPEQLELPPELIRLPKK